MGSLNDRLLPYFQHKNSIGKHTASTSIQQKQKCDSADISSVELLISRNYGSQIFWRKKQSGFIINLPMESFNFVHRSQKRGGASSPGALEAGDDAGRGGEGGRQGIPPL